MVPTSRRDMLKGIFEQLSASDYRITRQRRVIIGVLLDAAGRHLTAEGIYDLVRASAPDIGVATVYRTLDVLSGLGIVRRLDFGDGKGVFELGHDPHQHHHLICLSCGSVAEFADDLLDSLEEEIGRREEFDVVDHDVRFFGVCGCCQPGMPGR